MVDMIKKDARLAPYLNTALEDAGIEVKIDSTLTPEDYAAIKVDEYLKNNLLFLLTIGLL